MGEHKHNSTALQFANQPNQMQVRIDINDTTEDQCVCGGTLFDLAFKRRTLSGLSPKNPTGKDVAIKFEALICRKCGLEFGKVNEIVTQ